ncbi:hypothetical protein OCU04_000782 [Sclerotinia nivalis]|uniref:Uncharacterized protein n=1 Tax=Sclerotinia nivalis TaxID=352851 RepID=A0A9X0AZZ4_9HELO|nr:hypothetical protein OCU04_000782 [Sclerotinia nivalis]
MEAPNLDRLSQAFGIVSEECPKFKNIPVFHQGTEILNALAQLSDRIGGLQEQLEQMQRQQNQIQETQSQLREIQLQMGTQIQQLQTRMDERWLIMDQKFDTLETRIIALNLNSASRTQNSMVTFIDRELSPLVNARTSEAIPEFPQTPGALSCMSGVNINRVLLALGISTSGSLDVRRDRLRVAVGMKVGGV